MQNQKSNNTITKKIGQTTYKVQIHFSKSSKEHFSDMLLRIIKNDTAGNSEAC